MVVGSKLCCVRCLRDQRTAARRRRPSGQSNSHCLADNVLSLVGSPRRVRNTFGAWLRSRFACRRNGAPTPRRHDVFRSPIAHMTMLSYTVGHTGAHGLLSMPGVAPQVTHGSVPRTFGLMSRTDCAAHTSSRGIHMRCGIRPIRPEAEVSTRASLGVHLNIDPLRSIESPPDKG